MRSLPGVVNDRAKLNHVRSIARDLGGRIYSDVPYIKIKFYKATKFPESLAWIMRNLLPKDSFEIYQAHAPYWCAQQAEGVPAVRIRRETPQRNNATRGELIATLVPEIGNEDCLIEASTIFPGKLDGITPIYILHDTEVNIYFMSLIPFTLKNARSFDKG